MRMLGRLRMLRSVCPKEGKQISVLVAEDHPPLRELIAAVLDNAGYNVMTAECGDEALRIAHESDVDLLLTDVTMPGLSASSLIDQFQSLSRNSGVVIMSGDNISSDGRALKVQERVQFLQKPFTSKSLLATITQTLSDRPH
jgi:two-component system, cell cycle sensor histidine kinase and response regulator CckA